jgi:radical SAM superfamily enzyme YgiQ (UPF0313 family)
MGLKCLLISSNQVVSPYPVFPLGAAHLVGALESAGHNVIHFDVLSSGSDKLLDIVRNSHFDLIAISIRNLDSTDSSAPNTFIHHASDLMVILREESNAPIVIGGSAFSILPEEIFAILKPNYGVVGEGEHVLPWLADSLAEMETPAEGIIYADRKDCPWKPVSYGKSITDYYLKWGGMLNIQTKRGCPYRCRYCSYPALEGKKVRYRDPVEVADEVAKLSRDFGAKYIFFADAVFNDSSERYLEVAEALIKNGNKTPWCAFFRPVNLSRENIALMKRAGLSAMELGTDASSDTTLEGLQKDFSFADVIKTNLAAAAEQVAVAHFIIFGGPKENHQTLKEGLANINGLKHSVVFGFVGIRILPNTGIYDIAVNDGIISRSDQLMEPVFYYSPEISRQDIDQEILQQWQGRFDRIYPWVEMEPRIRRLQQKGYIGPIWDFLVKN